MKKIVVAVGSTRRPKLNAVWEALSVIGPTLREAALFDVVGVEVESGVGHTPLSRAELMAGARRRVDALRRTARERNEPWEYFVGLEGGFDVVWEPALNGSATMESHTVEARRGIYPERRRVGPTELRQPGGHGFSRAEPQPLSTSPQGLQPPRRLVFLESWAYVSDGSRGAYGQSGAILVPEPLAHRVVDEGVELSVAIDAFVGDLGIRDQQGAWGVFTRNLHTRQDSFRTAVINAFAPFFNAPLYHPK